MSKETMDILIALKKDYIRSLLGGMEEEDVPLSELLTADELLEKAEDIA